MDTMQLEAFATRYARAWCSQNASTVAAFFAENGSLTINDSPPAVGRAAIAASAQDFMTAFPDMVVAMDGIITKGDLAVFHWTLIGTNTGPGGSGRPVRISGYEEWTIGPDGLVADSTVWSLIQRGTSTKPITNGRLRGFDLDYAEKNIRRLRRFVRSW